MQRQGGTGRGMGMGGILNPAGMGNMNPMNVSQAMQANAMKQQMGATGAGMMMPGQVGGPMMPQNNMAMAQAQGMLRGAMGMHGGMQPMQNLQNNPQQMGNVGAGRGAVMGGAQGFGMNMAQAGNVRMGGGRGEGFKRTYVVAGRWSLECLVRKLLAPSSCPS